MKIVKYLFVNDTRSKNPLCDAGRRNVSDFRYNITVEPGSLNSVDFRFQDSGSRNSNDLKLETCNLKQRNALIAELVRLRRHYPDAKILGLSEIDTSSAYAPIKVSPWMNQLRREMSDLP